jgi:hypothetical protein
MRSGITHRLISILRMMWSEVCKEWVASEWCYGLLFFTE